MNTIDKDFNNLTESFKKKLKKGFLFGNCWEKTNY